ncbi:LysR family transcriptional regulator [Rhodoferax saidenbachensis]|uniref:LysR family transcriptional regulator n=1 Tax=Rhodoferax saidenbachensis TaxID=1484693 RepID=A0A1P8KBR1_9BURK|nr:LysR family transcriptional regulator [Rhodoferax saidenbachensis]APW43441.1 LysR family transcriptional regulator [Rhodoferax saidenbachensis]
MHISFRQLRLVLALAETGSVSAAARVMHVTQPTASMQLKEVADILGMPIFEVVARKLYLTAIGEELARTARTLSDEWNVFEQQVEALKGHQRGKLRIAVVSTAKYFVPRLLGTFCKRYPEIDVSLEVLNRDGVVGRLKGNLDDIYVMSTPPADMDLVQEVFMPNPLVAICASSNPLAKRKDLVLADLAPQRFILREEGSGTRMAIDRFFKKEKFRPSLRLELGSNEAIKESVAGGLGMSIVSIHALHGRSKEHGVSVLNVEGLPIQSSWHIVYPKGKKLSPIADIFRQHLRDSAQGLRKLAAAAGV